MCARDLLPFSQPVIELQMYGSRNRCPVSYCREWISYHPTYELGIE
jgi:hypothetical protein